MLDAVKELQNNAVSRIIKVLEAKREVTFKAPTGAGKTHMMAELMNEIIKEQPDTVFVVSSLSKGGLARQNFEKFVEYGEHEFGELNPFLISSEAASEERLFIPENFNVYVLPRDLFRDRARIKDEGSLFNYLYVTSKRMMGCKNVILIKDEAHIATNNLDSLLEAFSKIINISATPKLSRRQIPDVEITDDDAVRCGLIKRVCFGDDHDTVEKAFEKLLQLQKQYIAADFGMKPCLIIQISNAAEAESQLASLKATMALSYKDLHWCLILNKEKNFETNDKVLTRLNPARWKDEVKKNTSTIDVIIFKMVITEGWDIPRACILYQIRDVHSKQLDEQVMGRVRRNPKLLDFESLSAYAQEIATTAYIWGISPLNISRYREVQLRGQKESNPIQEELSIMPTRLKPIFEINTFDLSGFIQQQPNTESFTKKSIFDIYKKCKTLKGETQRLYTSFVKGTDTWFSFMANAEAIDRKVKDIETDYEKNMEICLTEEGCPLMVSVPYKSSFSEGSFRANITNWIWARTDGCSSFNFDSSAEKQWCSILAKIARYRLPNSTETIAKSCIIKEEDVLLWGKNFLENSGIKFEYYLYGIHASYPDFIMKDSKNRIHLFETKSLNEGYGANVKEAEYVEKIEALKKCYLYASKLVPYYFYIPELKDNQWEIHCYHQGDYVQLDELALMFKLSGAS